MVTSVIREEVMSKMGGQEGVAHCSADLWSMPLNEKREAGTIYTGLRVIEKTKSEGSKGYDTLTLSIPPQPEEDFAPNFRQGDMAWLYAYREGKTPDARHSILYHCTIERIEMDRLRDGKWTFRLGTRRLQRWHGNANAITPPLPEKPKRQARLALGTKGTPQG